MPLLAAAAAVAANDDNDNRGIEIQTFPVMDATYTADVVVKPMYTNCSRQQQSEITTSLLFLLVVLTCCCCEAIGRSEKASDFNASI